MRSPEHYQSVKRHQILTLSLVAALAAACDPNLPPEDSTAGETGSPPSTSGASTTTTSTSTSSSTSTTAGPSTSTTGQTMTECGPYNGDPDVECCRHHKWSFDGTEGPNPQFPHPASPLGEDGDPAPSDVGLFCNESANGPRINLSKKTFVLNFGFPAIGGMFFDWPSPQSSMDISNTIFDDYYCSEPIADDPSSLDWTYISEMHLASAAENCRNELVAEGCTTGSLNGPAYPDQWGATDICNFYYVFPMREQLQASTYRMYYNGDDGWEWVNTSNTQCDYSTYGLENFTRYTDGCAGGADSSSGG